MSTTWIVETLYTQVTIYLFLSFNLQVEEALNEVDFQLKLDLHFTDSEQQWVMYLMFSKNTLKMFDAKLVNIALALASY